MELYKGHSAPCTAVQCLCLRPPCTAGQRLAGAVQGPRLLHPRQGPRHPALQAATQVRWLPTDGRGAARAGLAVVLQVRVCLVFFRYRRASMCTCRGFLWCGGSSGGVRGRWGSGLAGGVGGGSVSAVGEGVWEEWGDRGELIHCLIAAVCTAGATPGSGGIPGTVGESDRSTSGGNMN